MDSNTCSILPVDWEITMVAAVSRPEITARDEATTVTAMAWRGGLPRWYVMSEDKASRFAFGKLQSASRVCSWGVGGLLRRK